MAKIGRLTILLLISSKEKEKELFKKVNNLGYKICIGKVGTMKSNEIIAAIETAAKREGIFHADNYRGEHSLYHTALNALKGLCRGEIGIGDFFKNHRCKICHIKGSS